MPRKQVQRITVAETAVEAVARGFQPIPLLNNKKMPALAAWTKVSWDKDNPEHVKEKFDEWIEQGHTNLGLLLGEASGGLIDVDIDHPRAMRLRDYFLPPTAMRTGRPGRRNSHYWYLVDGPIPGTRRYKMPKLDSDESEVSVELRASRAQTVIPPSVHPSGEEYLWEGEPWGGKEGPARIDSKVLSVRVATLGLASVLLDNWPKRGGRHDAYLALAGGLLRYGDAGRIHPFWERALPGLIGPMAEATNDDDGPETRIKEVMGTTLSRLRRGEDVVGFGTLAEIIGQEHVKQVKSMVREVASLAGFESEFSVFVDDVDVSDSGDPAELLEGLRSEQDEQDELDPLSARAVSWERVNLDPYLAGEVRPPEPEIMFRNDGLGLMYAGRVNMLYGSSESAKSWIALHACRQQMSKGERIMYLDFEDEPVNTLDRLRRLGTSPEDIRLNFVYIRPEEPLEDMQRSKWGEPRPTQIGRLNQVELNRLLDETDPSLIVADGMTALYGLHGLDTNDSSNTDVITSWLKKMTRNGRSTVILIDHTVKSPERGSLPIGSGHKQAMVQGTMLQVWPVQQPRKGALGLLDLLVLKDRLGSVREFASNTKGKKVQHAGRVVIDSREPNVTNLFIEPPQQTEEQLAALELTRSREARRAEEAVEWEKKVLHVFGGELEKSLAMREIVEALGVPESQKRRVKSAVQRLEETGWLLREGNTRGVKFTLIVADAGFNAEDNSD